MSDDSYYLVLGVSETATEPEIKAAYRDLLKKIHPDTVATLSPQLKHIAESATKEINEAYSVLSDVSKRRDYDQRLAENRQRPVLTPATSSSRSGRRKRRRRRNVRRVSRWDSLKGWAFLNPWIALAYLLVLAVVIFAIVTLALHWFA